MRTQMSDDRIADLVELHQLCARYMLLCSQFVEDRWHEVFTPDGVSFRMYARRAKATELRLPMSGYHNVENAAGVYAAARSLGLSHQEIARGFRTFKGVKRRQEERELPREPRLRLVDVGGGGRGEHLGGVGRAGADHLRLVALQHAYPHDSQARRAGAPDH